MGRNNKKELIPANTTEEEALRTATKNAEWVRKAPAVPQAEPSHAVQKPKQNKKARVSRSEEAVATSACRPTLRLLYPQDGLFFAVGLLLSAVLFSNGFAKELVFDDLLAIDRNPDASTDKGVPLKDIFIHDFWGHHLDEVSSNGSYRPLTMLSFRFQYVLAGLRHDPVALHVFNYIVAFSNAWLVYYVARLYQGMVRAGHPSTAPQLQETADGKRMNGARGPSGEDHYAVPALAMVLFLAHPVHVDAVTSVVGRCELLYCFFGLLAFFAMHAFATRCGGASDSNTAGEVRKSSHDHHHNHHQGRRRWSVERVVATVSNQRVMLLTLVAIFLVCSILCKDSGVIFTAVFIVHTALLYAWGFTSGLGFGFVTTVSVAMALAYFTFRRNFVGEVDLSKSKLLRRAENPQYFIPDGIWHWLSMRWTIQVKNLELLFYPTRLCCEYSYDCIPHMNSIKDERLPYYVGISIILLIVIQAALRYAMRYRNRLAVVLLMFLLWIAIPYAPVSHLFVRVGTFIAERCLYVPSIGVVLIYSFLAQPTLSALKPMSGVSATDRSAIPRTWLALALVGMWLVLSHRRNSAWDTNEALFAAALEVCPNSAKAHENYATALTVRRQGITEEALTHFRRALEIDDEEASPLYYLAADAWDTKHNAQLAIKMARACTNSPFSVTRCYPLYVQMRQALYPNMTLKERLYDDGMILPLPSQQAQRFREAALLEINEPDAKPCAGVSALQSALHRWNESQLFWQSDEASPEYGKETFCNSAYWWAQGYERCFLEPNVAPAGRTVEVVNHDGETVPALKLKTAQRALRDLRMAALSCTTDWQTPRLVRGAKERHLPRVANRLREFVPLSRRLRLTLAAMKPYLIQAPELRMAKVTALQLVVSSYCDAATFSEAVDVRARLRPLFPAEVKGVEEVAAGNLGRWRLEAVTLWKEVRVLEGDTQEETAALTKAVEEVKKLAQCTASLPSVIN